jgi:hypothetical protein
MATVMTISPFEKALFWTPERTPTYATTSTRPIRLGSLAAGSGWIPIIGYGEIAIKAKAPEPRGQRTVKLHDVAFVPLFFTSVVSLKKLIKGGIDWLIRQNRLLLGNQVFCFAEERFGQ